MRIPQTVMATAAVVTTLVGMSVTGCSSHSKSSTPTSGSGAPSHAPIVDYTQLLIKAERHQCTRYVYRRPADQRSEWPTGRIDHVH